jgi:hypothetical protein
MSDLDRTAIAELGEIERTLNRIESLLGFLVFLSFFGFVGIIGTLRHWF